MTAANRIRHERLVALLRGVEQPDELVGLLATAGVGVVEVTLETPGARAAIERLRARRDVAVVAGTVRAPEDVDAAVAAGAEACVSPTLSVEVVARCHDFGVPAVPGALTPTEVEAAWRAGGGLVKLFPARLVGPEYVADLVKPLAEVPLLCTGGVTVANAAEFLAAGAVAVGISFGETTTEVEARRAVETVASAGPAGERKERP
jgi:2-dehydro-3-deoxyphosphogluconate aldolase/(4S)-4-hydroxy-2-oxoglutarate aldolase